MIFSKWNQIRWPRSADSTVATPNTFYSVYYLNNSDGNLQSFESSGPELESWMRKLKTTLRSLHAYGPERWGQSCIQRKPKEKKKRKRWKENQICIWSRTKYESVPNPSWKKNWIRRVFCSIHCFRWLFINKTNVFFFLFGCTSIYYCRPFSFFYMLHVVFSLHGELHLTFSQVCVITIKGFDLIW